MGANTRMLAGSTCGLLVAGLASVLAGCSMDTVIWGPEGARVIDTTTKVIDAAASGSAAEYACADSVADFGAPQDWDGLAAGEPEAFNAHHWSAQAPLDPAWSINLEGAGANAPEGEEAPGDVFYQRDGDDLCVVDVAWTTRISTG
jgi:hypothetical protein